MEARRALPSPAHTPSTKGRMTQRANIRSTEGDPTCKLGSTEGREGGPHKQTECGPPLTSACVRACRDGCAQHQKCQHNGKTFKQSDYKEELEKLGLIDKPNQLNGARDDSFFPPGRPVTVKGRKIYPAFGASA